MFFVESFIFVYIFFRAILPLRARLPVKAAATLGAVAVIFAPHILRIGAAGPCVPEWLPQPLLVIASWGFAVSFFFLILLAAADAVRLVRRAWRRFRSAARSGRARVSHCAVNLLLLVASSLLASCGMLEGIAEPKVIETEVRSPRLPEELDGFRIVLVTDLHVDSRRSRDYLPRIVERMNGLKPDLVAIAGDFADGRAADIAPRLEALRALKANYGVFGVAGNHEYYSDYKGYMAILPSLGVTMLENSHRMIRPDFAVAGITDPAAHRRRLPMPDLPGALNGIPGNAFVLLLAHRPRFFAEAAKRGVDLQLSGHTHGGLVWGLGPLIARTNGGFVAGLYRIDDSALYVSRGTATWGFGRLGFQARLGVPSEITLLVLRRP